MRDSLEVRDMVKVSPTRKPEPWEAGLPLAWGGLSSQAGQVLRDPRTLDQTCLCLHFSYYKIMFSVENRNQQQKEQNRQHLRSRQENY
jgi:hypothetical protein